MYRYLSEMIKKIALLLWAAIFILTGSNFAQQQQCSTDEQYQRLKAAHPEIALYEEQLEHAIRAKLDDHLAKTTSVPDTVTYDIPIVIHVIHDYGVENLSDNNIYDAVAYWATIFVAANADTADVIDPFKKYVGNAHIRLHLATIDPYGNPTKGIVRHHSYLTYNGGDNSKLDDWPPTKYVNVWFVNVFGSAYSNAAAYAYLPQSGAALPYYDGIIGLYNYLNLDKAIPHEFGHVFNLQHPWGNTNQPNVACGDDLVKDTPPTKGHLQVGCVAAALYDTTCTSVNNIDTFTNYLGVHDSVVHYPDTVNSQNIMDYTYCQKMFTNGQVFRMRAALTSSVAGRNNLYAPINLVATGAVAPMPDLAPIADFSVEKALTTVGITAERNYFFALGVNGNFRFKNQSWNDTVSSVLWSFSNGSVLPSSTSLNTVSTSFTQTGWVTISLTATSNAGANTITKPKAVYVADSIAFNPFGYEQDFIDTNSSANWPTFNYYENQFKWNFYTGAGYGDNSCMQFHSFDDRVAPANATGTPRGDYDDMFTPAFDLTSLKTGNAYLNFYTAGSKRSSSGNGNPVTLDTMDVYVSTSGGYVWYKIASVDGASLANNAAQSAEFIPLLASQWIPQSISIPTNYCTSKTFFKFRYRSGDHGNNLYMDKVYLSHNPTEANEVVLTPDEIKIYPNPANNGCNIVCMAGADGKASYQVTDITGRLLLSNEVSGSSNTLVQQHIEQRTFPAAGVYIITVTANGKKTTQKLVINQ
jgi:hypothetical protein